MKKLVSLFLSLVMVGAVLCGCGGGSSQGDEGSNGVQNERKANNEIVVAIAQDLEDSLDPHASAAAGTREVLFNVYEGLVKTGPDGELIPAVAERYDISDDGLVYTFTLREGVKFHNGDPVTAEDVIYSINRCAGNSGDSALVSALSAIQDLKATDERTVTFRLEQPDMELIYFLTAAIIPQSSEGQTGFIPGTGPFQLVSRSPQENIIMERFDDYWGTPAKVSKVTYQIYEDSTALMMALKGGSVDICAHLTSAQTAQLGDDFTVAEGTMNLVQAVYLNNARAPFDNEKVRQAMSYAINRQEIMDIMADGHGTAVGSSIYPKLTKYFLPELVDYYSYDPAKGKELLAEAGYPDGFDMTIAAAADEAGDLTHRGIRINSNGGSYAAHTHAVAAYAVTSNFQTYKASAVQIGESSTVYTNLPSAAAMRGYGIPQLNFAMESQMEDIARRNGWDPIDFRLQNINEAGFVDPFDKFTVRTCGLRECVEQGRRLCDWDRKRKEYDAFNKTSPNLKKGLGMALFSYKIGVYPLQLESGSCRIVMNEDGSAQIMVGCAELGQGSDTAMCQIVSQITTIPEQKLSVCSAQDTDITPYDNGAYASRQTYISGSGAKLAAEKLVDTILTHAARTYKLPKDELRLASEQIWHRDSAVCTLAQLCTYINFVNDQKTDTDHITAEATFTMKNICLAYGVSFMDLEVDVPVGKVKIRKVYCLQDSGKIINPQLAEGQMHGGVAMGIDYALGEQMLFDAATGRPLNNNLLDYKIPTCMDIPDMEIRFVETHEDSAPFGAKGLAEPPLIPQAAAVRNAILHATGVGMHKLPMNPQNLVHAFGEAGLIAQ